MLMALGEPLPKRVFGHGWLVLESGKMSKSKGNVIDPLVLIDKYGLDAIRYYLLREIPFGSDGFYSEDALKLRINTDLANDLGNLLHRTLSMIEKFTAGVIPAPGTYSDLDREVINQAEESITGMKRSMGSPVASAAGTPNIFSAAGLNRTIFCSELIEMIASIADAMMPSKRAVVRASASSACLRSVISAGISMMASNSPRSST
jgi:methionyl-tRNA synthetase